MIIISGKIEKNCTVNLTCCDSTNDVIIGKRSLYEMLQETFDLKIPDDSDYSTDKLDDMINVSYLILDDNPGEIYDYESFIGEWIVKKLYSNFVSGCYSEWTCGWGDYEYLFGTEEGHSIGTELSSYVGKYVILRINDKRDIIIDSLLNDED